MSDKQIHDLAPGLSSEEMSALFFDSDVLQEQPVQLYRVDFDQSRYYYSVDQKGDLTVYTSVTTLISITMPTSKHLIKWYAEMGWEAAKEYSEEMAHYGTFMHIEIQKLLISRKCDLTEIDKRLEDYIAGERIGWSFMKHLEPLKKDILAFAQFMIDHDVKPLAIELVMAHPDGYAGAVDLYCEMSIDEMGEWGEVYASGERKGEPKRTKKNLRVKAVIDFKRGRKGFYESHEIQLHAYRNLLVYNLNTSVDKLFNWSPKDWRGTTPTYNLKDQTNSHNLSKFPYLVELARIEQAKREKFFTVIKGVIDLDQGDLSDNIDIINVDEFIKSKTL